MCLETMDASPKHMTTTNNCLHKAMKSIPRPRWGPLQDQARCGAVRAALTRKCLRREQRRARFEKLALGELEEQKKQRKESPAVARLRHHSSGAMAPQNTTQYLMCKEYEDLEQQHVQIQAEPTPAHLYDDGLSPSGVYEALDSGYEACLTHQQRDFEEMFALAS